MGDESIGRFQSKAKKMNEAIDDGPFFPLRSKKADSDDLKAEKKRRLEERRDELQGADAQEDLLAPRTRAGRPARI